MNKPHETLRALLKNAGLTPEEGAKILGISRRTMFSWLAGDCPKTQIALGAFEKLKGHKNI